MKFILGIVLSISVVALSPCIAADKPEPAVNAIDKPSFETVAEWVRKQMVDGGRYAETNPRERTRVNAQLDDMAKMFAAHATVSQMSDSDRLKLFNSQQEINGILGKRDGERLICSNDRPVGSNIPVKTCHTAASMDARRRSDVKDLKDRQDVTRQLRNGN